MPSSLSSPSIPSNWRSYTDFSGMDRSRDITALEVINNPASKPRPQPFWLLKNCHSDLQGILERDPVYRKRNIETSGRVDSVRFIARNSLVWAETDGAGVNLLSNAPGSPAVGTAYPIGSIVTFTKFMNNTFAFSREEDMYRFDGNNWAVGTVTDFYPAFGVAVQNRLWVSGFQGETKKVSASRLRNYNIFDVNESPSSAEAGRASYLDISNTVDKGHEITGLGAFEGDKLAIFTGDEVLIYIVDEDVANWRIDSRANIKIGCLSHRTILNIGQDLVYCSRYGVHLISRSDTNGVTVYPLTLSQEILKYYQQLVTDTLDFETISAFYDADNSDLHIYFPRFDGSCIRLSARIFENYERVHWSLGDFVNARCGDCENGDMVIGSPDGFYTPLGRAIKYDGFFRDDVPSAAPQRRPKMVAGTPILWSGDMFNSKATLSLLVHAFGKGAFTIKVYDQDFKLLVSKDVIISSDQYPNEIVPILPLSKEYTIPVQVSFRGLNLVFETTDTELGDIGIVGFAIELRQDSRRR